MRPVIKFFNYINNEDRGNAIYQSRDSASASNMGSCTTNFGYDY